MNNPLDSKTSQILQKGEYTTLALTDGNDPYTLTLYYGFNKMGKTLFFITEKRGMKLDYFKSNPFVCGTIIVKEVLDQEFLYSSLIYRGVLEVIHNPEEQRKALKAVERHNEFDIELSRLRNPILMKLEIEERDVREWKTNRSGIHSISLYKGSPPEGV